MSIEVFIDELRERFLPIGKLNVPTTKNVIGQPMPRFDDIWFVESTPSGVEVHIRDLQAYQPTVVVGVPSHLSLEYSLGSATSDVMQKANAGYAGLQAELKSIKQYADLILDAYNVAKAYDRATMLYNQFYGINKPERLQDAYKTLKGLNLCCPKCVQLLEAIKAAAQSNNIKLL